LQVDAADDDAAGVHVTQCEWRYSDAASRARGFGRSATVVHMAFENYSR
jgi:hypothetical protein